MAVTQTSVLAGQDELSRSDLQLIHRAVRNGWEITRRKEIIEAMEEIVANSEEKTRERITAASVCVAADKVNAMRERGEKPHEHVHTHQHVHITPQLTLAERTERIRELVAAVRSKRVGGNMPTPSAASERLPA